MAFRCVMIHFHLPKETSLGSNILGIQLPPTPVAWAHSRMDVGTRAPAHLLSEG